MKTYVVGRDGASRVSSNELELHVNLPEQILICRFKARAGGFVEPESKKLAVIENLGSTVAPCNLEVLVEVASRDNHERAHYKKRKKLQQYY